jgi:hypothetical protein
MGSLDSILAGQMKDRVVYRFTVPESIVGTIRSIGLVELTADEEIAVEARCKSYPEKRAVEIVKSTVWEVNGERIHNGAGELDKLWNNLPPKVRSLVNRAWVKLHAADDSESASFEKSMTVNV